MTSRKTIAISSIAGIALIIALILGSGYYSRYRAQQIENLDFAAWVEHQTRKLE